MSKTGSKLSDEMGPFIPVPREFVKAAKDLSDRARWLFVLLRSYANGQTGDAWPGYDELQEETGWRRADLSLALKELVDTGWVVKQRRFGASTIYKFSTPTSSPVRTNDSSPVSTTDEGQEFTRPNYSSSPVRTALVQTGGTLTRLNELDRNNKKEGIAADAASPDPAPNPSKKKTSAGSQPSPTPAVILPPAPPVPSAEWDAIEAAPPEARGHTSDSSTDPEALAVAIAEECGLDMRIKRQKKAALSAAQEISKAGATVGQVKHEFHTHWRTNVYRGMCGELPTTYHLVNEWGRWEHVVAPPTKPGTAARQPVDFEQQLVEAEARAARQRELNDTPSPFPTLIPAWQILDRQPRKTA